jgi:hypothetical protein
MKFVYEIKSLARNDKSLRKSPKILIIALTPVFSHFSGSETTSEAATAFSKENLMLKK